MCATLLCQMHPGRARCTFWPGRSKDQERPAHMAMPPRSYLQRIASTRVSASPPSHRCAGFRLPRRLRRRPPLRRVHLLRSAAALLVTMLLALGRVSIGCVPPSTAAAVSIASRQQTLTDTFLKKRPYKTALKTSRKRIRIRRPQTP